MKNVLFLACFHISHFLTLTIYFEVTNGLIFLINPSALLLSSFKLSSVLYLPTLVLKINLQYLMRPYHHAYWTLFHSISISNAIFLSSIFLFEALFFTQIVQINFLFETIPCKWRMTFKMYFLLIRRCLPRRHRT